MTDKKLAATAGIAIAVVGGAYLLIPREAPLDDCTCPRIRHYNTPAWPPNLVLCKTQNYISIWSTICQGESVIRGNPVVFAPVNYLHGGIGDWNWDADCGREDVRPLVECLSGPEIPAPVIDERRCRCVFDYDGDYDVDLRDVAEFQLGFGSGTTAWLARR